jgi:hypothetical protein
MLILLRQHIVKQFQTPLTIWAMLIVSAGWRGAMHYF